MAYLILAVLSSSLISILLRLSEKYIKNNMGMFMANYAVCLLLAAGYMGGLPRFSQEGAEYAVILGLGCGVLYLANFLLMQKNMKLNGVVLTSTFGRLGVIIPILLALVFFGEKPDLQQTLGVMLALGAIILIHFDSSAADRTGANAKNWLLVLLLMSGVTDSIANIFEKTGAAGTKDAYLLSIFLAALLSACFLEIRSGKRICRQDVLFGVLIGIPNYFSSRFLLLALAEVPAVVVYPAYSVAVIVVISLAGMFLFKETVSRRKKGALVMILGALIFLNL